MSHQGYEYWFPECLLCGTGNLGTVICTYSQCHEDHGLKLISEEILKEHEKDGHYWNGCQFCEIEMLADAGSWGSYAICVDCWNAYVKVNRFPPTNPSQIVDEVSAGKLKLGWKQTPATISPTIWVKG